MVPSFAALSRWGALTLSAGFCLVILMQLLTGRIRLGGLLSGNRSDGDTYFSFGRAQLLIVTLLTAGWYLFLIYQEPSHIPQISNTVVALFGGSAVLYCGEKFWAALVRDSGSSTRRDV